MTAPEDPDDSSISDDPGTILDTYENAAKPGPPPPPAAIPAARPPTSIVEEVLYTSPYRWIAPRIQICNDGSLEDGETVFVRSERVTIGRTKGDIVIGHDVAMSGNHAEIIRKDSGGKHAWYLRDLGSANGTLARARTVTLKPGTLIQLGSKRYRFELPGAASPPAADADGDGTALLPDPANAPAEALPALVENTAPGTPTGQRHALRAARVTIGRPGCGNNIEIDDICLAKTHAVITRDASGVWQLEALKSLNGVWVKVDAIKLGDKCLFQCGEQRFRFHL